MEYLLGSIITILIILVTKRFMPKQGEKQRMPIFRHSQSYLFELVKPFLVLPDVRIKLDSQSSRHYDKKHVRVILADGKAYWIMDNTFFEAEEFDGFIDKESAKPVDIMSMDKVQLDKMIVIVEALTEGGNNENWNSRK